MSDAVSTVELSVFNSLIDIIPEDPGVYYFNTGQQMPMRLGPIPFSFDRPDARKKFQNVIVHGSGTVFCRFTVDGRYVGCASAVLTETYGKPRRMALPRSTTGYTLWIEIFGFFGLDAIEVEFDYMPGES